MEVKRMPRGRTGKMISQEAVDISEYKEYNNTTDSQRLNVESLQKDVDDQTMSVIEAFNGEILSPNELIKKQKELLSERRKQIQIVMDGKKLEEAMKVMIGMQGITDVFSDSDVMESVKRNTKSPMDLKFLAEAYSKLADKLPLLQRLDTVDGEGTARKINLSVSYKNSDGSQLNATLKTD